MIQHNEAADRGAGKGNLAGGVHASYTCKTSSRKQKRLGA
jgi:hypothetical protein